MATVHKLLYSQKEFYKELQAREDIADARRQKRFVAVLLLQRRSRGHLIRKHVANLNFNATIIQCAFRKHQARKRYRMMLRRAVKKKHNSHYFKMATRIQALWRGHRSRSTKFWYKAYRRWLALVTERGERRAAEAEEFSIRSRADNIHILEEEARKWLAFVVFKLHHLIRTCSCAGVYSDPATTELSEFEKLLKSIHYTEYMKRLKSKYDEFVRQHRPQFSNKRLFPVIGDGADYWYLSLAEMYELTAPLPKEVDTRGLSSHRGKQHPKPFLWRKYTQRPFEGRGPFQPNLELKKPNPVTKTPPPSSINCTGDAKTMHEDPRFYLYVKHYTPNPKVFDYVDFHINAFLNRKCSVENIKLPKPPRR